MYYIMLENKNKNKHINMWIEICFHNLNLVTHIHVLYYNKIKINITLENKKNKNEHMNRWIEMFFHNLNLDSKT